MGSGTPAIWQPGAGQPAAVNKLAMLVAIASLAGQGSGAGRLW
jgi:hypothetical protein